jgi:hypothetical protein
MCAAEFFRQRPNFLADLAEFFYQKLATLFATGTAYANETFLIGSCSWFSQNFVYSKRLKNLSLT